MNVKKIKNKLLAAIERLFKQTAETYCTSFALTLAVFYLLDTVDALSFSISIQSETILTFYRVAFLFFFLVFGTVYSSCILTDYEALKNASVKERIKNYFSRNKYLEILYITVTALLFILLYFIFKDISPFVLLYTTLGETLGFVISIVLISLIRLLGIALTGNLGAGPNPLTFKERMSIFALCFIIYFILFAPVSDDSLPRNLPLFFALIVIFVSSLVCRYLVHIATVVKIANKLRLKKAKDIKCNYFRSPRKNDITYIMNGKRNNLKILFSVDKKARYYFENSSMIRKFFATSLSYRTGRNLVRTNTHAVQWHESAPQRLPWKTLNEDENYILLFKHMPTELSDQYSRDRALGTNDMALGKIKINTVKGFSEYV